MSLINDALKRAGKVQSTSPAPHIPGPPLGAAESAGEDADKRGGLFGTAGLVTVVALALAILWFSLRTGSQAPSTVQARTQDTSMTPEKPASPASVPTPATVAAPVNTSVSNSPTAAVGNAQPTTGSVSNLPVSTVQSLPAPPPLKLQAIVFNPRRPSAIVNGHTLFVGDRYEDMRVVSITSDTATLVGNGQTNRLRLAQ